MKTHQGERPEDADLRDWNDVTTSQRIPAVTRNCKSQGRGSPSETSEVVQPCGHLDIRPSETDFGLLASRPLRAYISVASTHQVYGDFLQQPQEANTLL